MNYYFDAPSTVVKTDIDPSCKLTGDINRDCCMNRPIMMCRIFASLSAFILLLSLSVSLFLFLRRHYVGKETFNVTLHLLINLTFLSRIFIYLDSTWYQFNWTSYLMVKYLPNIFSSQAIITFVVQW